MKTSLIISTYNRPDALAVCLDSIRYQTLLPTEVIIGDDGSKLETKELIEKIKLTFPIPLIHIWQEDLGFRLAMMRNKAIAQSVGDYIIEIDGDVFLHKRFVEDHIRLASPKCYLKGTRVRLNEKLTNEICKERLNRKIYPWTLGIESKAETAIYLKWLSTLFADRFKKYHISGLGCNMSFWRSDVLAVNGYDEFFEGWGGEDDDLAHRLHRYGCRKRALRFSGIVYHLWHGMENMENKEKNYEYRVAKDREGTIWCNSGIDKYLIDSSNVASHSAENKF